MLTQLDAVCDRDIAVLQPLQGKVFKFDCGKITGMNINFVSVGTLVRPTSQVIFKTMIYTVKSYM